MTYEEIVAEVSDYTGISKQVVDRTYKAYWRAVREHITSLELKKDLTDEEFERIRPNVNIPSIGKLYITLGRYHRLKKKGEYYKSNTEEYGITHQEN